MIKLPSKGMKMRMNQENNFDKRIMDRNQLLDVITAKYISLAISILE